jgi:hypothetical protein
METAAVTDAAALIARAAGGDRAGMWALADDISVGDHTRATVVELAGAAAGGLLALSAAWDIPLGAVLDLVAKDIAERLTEQEA